MAQLSASQERELRDAFDLFDTGIMQKRFNETIFRV